MAIKDLYYESDGIRSWVFRHKDGRQLLSRNDVRAMGRDWHMHSAFAKTNFSAGILRIQQETDSFLATLGYCHDLENNCYYMRRQNEERVALFAHEGVGVASLSCMLDIPYPMFSTHFDITHTGVTVIQFEEQNGSVIPKLLSFSNDSHLYREGLPTKHQNKVCY